MRVSRRAGSLVPLALLWAASACAAGADAPVERWAKAVGGREKVAAVNSIYREATIQIGGSEGTLKAWHTPDGRYRKEESVGQFRRIETFDGKVASVQLGAAPTRNVAGPELARAISQAFANWNAVFFAFFPERRHGDLTVEGRDTLVIKPTGGIDWRVVLDPATSLPKSMTHAEGDRLVRVEFAAYETVDGLQIEKEIHRSNGDPRFDAVIRFTRTVFNPPIEASLFSIEPVKVVQPQE